MIVAQTSSLSFSNIRYWAFHWDSGPPTIVTLSTNEVQHGLVIGNAMIVVTIRMILYNLP